MEMETLTTIMEFEAKKKNSVRYKATEEDAPFQTVYLVNEAYKTLGSPERIIVTVEKE